MRLVFPRLVRYRRLPQKNAHLQGPVDAIFTRLDVSKSYQTWRKSQSAHHGLSRCLLKYSIISSNKVTVERCRQAAVPRGRSSTPSLKHSVDRSGNHDIAGSLRNSTGRNKENTFMDESALWCGYFENIGSGEYRRRQRMHS